MQQTAIPTPAATSRLNDWLARLMILGVWLAAILCTLGLALSLLRGEPPPPLKPFTGVDGLATPAQIFASALRFEARGFMALGILVLIATPVARVAFSLVTFAVERDKVYIVITSIVLALLAVGLFTGLH